MTCRLRTGFNVVPTPGQASVHRAVGHNRRVVKANLSSDDYSFVQFDFEPVPAVMRMLNGEQLSSSAGVA